MSRISHQVIGLGAAWIMALGPSMAQNPHPPTVSGQGASAISTPQSAQGVGHAAAGAAPAAHPSIGEARVYFTPWDDAEGAIMRAIRAAEREVLVQAYSFTSGAIAGELIAAKRRGIDVRVTADANETERIPTSRIADLARAGIPVWLETRYQAAHNKTMVIDAGTQTPVVITGSYNWTVAAQRRNSENVLIISGAADLARSYKANWERQRVEAQVYRAK